MGRVDGAALAALAASTALSAGAARAAEPVMVQCGRAYQAAKAAGTLDGQDWGAYRTVCAERLKGAAAPTPAAPPAVQAAASPAAPSAAPLPGGGAAAMHARQKQCGAEWRAGKPTLVAQTPGLTWPKFWSGCNARLKAAGG